MKDLKSNLQALVRIRPILSLFMPDIDDEHYEVAVELTNDPQVQIPSTPTTNSDQDCACE